ncbi:STY4528 family pathogenicity island replication protein [Serratia marcescens]|uniref:STY4528 family pathogenicity island replication protein n=1 Tax=Serratia marcescens TaxID=615 RepID=UPI0040361CDB
MTDYRSNFTPQAPEALFTTPTALMLDIRLTPLERNGWQVLRMLRTTDGHSSLANLAQLRRYLTSTPLGQRAGYETAWRVLIVLRLTGWISLVGQHRDPLSGHVLSEVYQVHESALTFRQACDRDPGLPKLLQASIGHENNQVDRVAMHIRDGLEPIAAAHINDAQARRYDDEDPPSSPPPGRPMASQAPPSIDSVSESSVPQQNDPAHQTMQQYSPTYKEDKYKKYVRTARVDTRGLAPTCAREPGAPLPLPPCLERAAEDQRRDMQTALRRLPRQVGQEVLQELEARYRDGGVRNVVAYLFALIRRVGQGEFRLWAGKRLTSPAQPAAQHTSSGTAQGLPSAPESMTPVFKPAAPEVVRRHMDSIRSMLNMPAKVGDLAAEMMQSGHWKPGPA